MPVAVGDVRVENAVQNAAGPVIGAKVDVAEAQIDSAVASQERTALLKPKVLTAVERDVGHLKVRKVVRRAELRSVGNDHGLITITPAKSGNPVGLAV